MKMCRKCVADEWHARKKGGYYCVPCGRAAVAKWQRANPERMRAAAAKWYAAHRDRERARAAQYRAAHPEKVRANNARWYAENPEKGRAASARWHAANPDKVKALSAQYCAENPEKRVVNEAKRRARKLAAPGRGVTAAQWQEVLDASLGICAYCNERKPLTMDHIESLGTGGAHDTDNITAACQPCNSSKGDTPLLLWLAKKANRRAA